MQIDQYGFEAVSSSFQRRTLQPYRVKRDGDITYMCFEQKEVCPIHRITQDEEVGETIIEWAFGSWENKDTLSYVPINETLVI